MEVPPAWRGGARKSDKASSRWEEVRRGARDADIRCRLRGGVVSLSELRLLVAKFWAVLVAIAPETEGPGGSWSVPVGGGNQAAEVIVELLGKLGHLTSIRLSLTKTGAQDKTYLISLVCTSPEGLGGELRPAITGTWVTPSNAPRGTAVTNGAPSKTITLLLILVLILLLILSNLPTTEGRGQAGKVRRLLHKSVSRSERTRIRGPLLIGRFHRRSVRRGGKAPLGWWGKD